MKPMRHRVPVMLAAVAHATWALCALADKWPQWMGPGRDNVWRERGIAAALPAGCS